MLSGLRFLLYCICKTTHRFLQDISVPWVYYNLERKVDVNMNKNEMFWHITCRSKVRGSGVMLQYSRVMHVQIIMHSHKYAYSYLTCAFLVHWHAFTICDIVFMWNGREILVIRCAVTKDANRHLRVQKLKSNPSNIVFVLPSKRHFGSFDACLCYYCHHAIDLLFRQIIKGSKLNEIQI